MIPKVRSSYLGFERFKRSKDEKKEPEKDAGVEKPKTGDTEKGKDTQKPTEEKPKSAKIENVSSFAGGSSDNKNQNSWQKPPQENRNYLPLAIIGFIYLLYAIKPGNEKDGYMSYRVDLYHEGFR